MGVVPVPRPVQVLNSAWHASGLERAACASAAELDRADAAITTARTLKFIMAFLLALGRWRTMPRLAVAYRRLRAFGKNRAAKIGTALGHARHSDASQCSSKIACHLLIWIKAGRDLAALSAASVTARLGGLGSLLGSKSTKFSRSVGSRALTFAQRRPAVLI